MSPMALAYDDMDLLRPCNRCGSRPYWLGESGWTCEQCEPPALNGVIRAELDEHAQLDKRV